MSQTKVKSGLLNFPDQTDFVKLPSGTTAQRPSSPEEGYSRYNTTDNKLEFWNGTEWQQLPGLTPPIITSISYPGDDLAADPDGGQTITINGGDFKAGATVTVDGTTPSVITFVSAAEITFTAPAKATGDYNIVVTNLDGGNATAVDGMTYNGLPSWTTPAGNLGTFAAGSTIPTITLVATEPDSGTVSYSVTTGALPTGLALTGADIDGTVPFPAGETTYNFSVTASDDENQSTERAFNIVVYLQVTNTVNEVDPFGDSSGVALYKLDGDATDESGNYNGTEYNTPSYGSGVFGQGYSNNGSNKYILLPRIISTDFTWSFWVKFNSLSNTRFFGVEGGIVEPDLVFQIISNNLSYYGGSSIGTNTLISSPQTGHWYHIVAVSGSGVYVNGNFYAESGLSQPSSGGNIGIGSDGIDIGEVGYLDGSIDQVRIFNKAISPLEVESLYRERTVLCGGQANTLDILGDNSCIATYQLNGNANDLSGNYSGTPTDVSYGVGEFDLAGVFNGSSSAIALPQNSLNSFTEYSISTWINTSSSADQTIINNWGYQNGSTEQGWLIQKPTSNKIRVINYNGGSAQVYDSTGVISLSTWVNVIVTNTQSQIKIYFNGVLDSTHSSSGFTFNASYPMRPHIGAYQYSAGTYGFFNGSIDKVRIFNKALNSTEVTTLYNETACDALACSGTTNTLDILSDGSCIAAYPLDGSPADLSGNYNGVQTDVTYPVGKFDLSGSFNGSSSYIDTSYTVPASTAASISSWFNTSSTGNYRTLFSDAPSNGAAVNTRMQIYFTPTNTFDVIIGNNSGYWIGSSNSIASYIDGNWHNLIATYNGTDVKVYIDGSLFQSFTSTISFGTAGNQSLVLGKAGLNNVNYWLGSIDQVRIFDKALSAGEVTTLYNETACN